MLYLNSVENAAASKTDKKYAICYEKFPPCRMSQNWGHQRNYLHNGNLKKSVGKNFVKLYG